MRHNLLLSEFISVFIPFFYEYSLSNIQQLTIRVLSLNVNDEMTFLARTGYVSVILSSKRKQIKNKNIEHLVHFKCVQHFENQKSYTKFVAYKSSQRINYRRKRFSKRSFVIISGIRPISNMEKAKHELILKDIE